MRNLGHHPAFDTLSRISCTDGLSSLPMSDRFNRPRATSAVVFFIHRTSMNSAARPKLVFLFHGAVRVLLALTGIAFLAGSGLIHALTDTDRVLAEMEGIALAALFLGLGLIIKMCGDRIEEGDSSTSLTECLRK
jgi:hypothetical protein